MLKVNEIFVSIQGESTFAGLPCVFVRLAGCNLRCKWCDTQYAWNNKDAESYSVEDLIERIFAEKIHLVEITGGEPLLQEETIELIHKLTIIYGITVLLETNGTQDLGAFPDVLRKCSWFHIIMDYKCISSGVDVGQLGHVVYDNLSMLREKDELKFVIGDRKDWEQMVNVIKTTPMRCQILVSPVFGQVKPRQIAQWILEDPDIIDHKVRMQVQMHKVIWDPEERER